MFSCGARQWDPRTSETRHTEHDFGDTEDALALPFPVCPTTGVGTIEGLSEIASEFEVLSLVVPDWYMCRSSHVSDGASDREEREETYL
jgi:hypothetical protein